MDFFIVTSDSKLFEYDQSQLDLMNQENIVRHGLLVDTMISDYKGEVITIQTTIEIARIATGTIDIAEPKRLLTFRGKTLFKITEPNVLTFGVTDHAISIFERMFTLSQAHAYGAFNVTVREMNLVRLPMEVAPIEQYLGGISKFLSANMR